MANSDDSWNKFGEFDPYYGVLSEERYRRSGMTGEARAEFFKSGERHVEMLFATIRAHVDPRFSPRSALDFGCGVGRLAIPLARRIPQVFGADVSQPMLREAARNCTELGIENVSFVLSDDALEGVPSNLEFVHSFIVFQHIPTSRGLPILGKILELLADDGVGALHFAFAQHASRVRTLLRRISRVVPFANNFYNLVRGARFSDPQMEMNSYDLNKILDYLYAQRCHDVHLRFSNHAGFVGAMLYFKKRAIPAL